MKDSDVAGTNGSSASEDPSEDPVEDFWDLPIGPPPASGPVSQAAEAGPEAGRGLGPLLSLPDDFWSEDEADTGLPPDPAELDEPWPTVAAAPVHPANPAVPVPAVPPVAPLLELPDDFWAGDEVSPVDRRERPPGRPAPSPTPPEGSGTVPAARPRPTLVPAVVEQRSTVRNRWVAGLLALGATAAVVTAVLLGGGSDGDDARQLEAALPRSTLANPSQSTAAPRGLPVTGATTTSAPATTTTLGPYGAGTGTGNTPTAAAGGADGNRASDLDDPDPEAGSDDTDPESEVPAAPGTTRRRDATTQTTAPPTTTAPPPASLTRLPGVEQEVLAFTNADRAGNGKPPVSRNGCMDGEASAWARHMADTTVMVHSADGGAAVQGCRGADAYWGDNIGHWEPCYASEMEEWWMNSPSHRPHILDANFTVVGIGVWAEPSGRCWFQVYFGS